MNKSNFTRCISSDGLGLKIGPFTVCLKSSVPSVAEHLIGLYGGFKLVSKDEFIDFQVSIGFPNNLRRFIYQQAIFSFDNYYPFLPLPLPQAGAMFEWGLNWCVANQSHQYLIIHAAVVERDGYAIILPGVPGSGKSTLCAALVCSGWRLLSDEMTLLSLVNGRIYPIPRPISLKNQSIDIIKNFSDKAVITSIVPNTIKGTLGHMRTFEKCLSCIDIPAIPSRIIFPRYTLGSNNLLKPINKHHAFMKVAENSFNFNVLGAVGFNAIKKLIVDCDVYEFEYHSLREAIMLFEQFGL
ncbi:MAG: HprK-related kinase A [Methylomonas sp.]|nr:HprK-related kinase A [Methylomonas sp.]